MNERILELAKTAGITFKPMMIDDVEYEYRYVKFNDNNASDEANCLEKFAELIVRECGIALSPMLRDMISRGQAYDLVKKHFGVAEREE